MKQVLHVTPEPSTEFTIEPVLRGAEIHYGYERDGSSVLAGLRFLGVKGRRWRAEGFCTPWHIEGVYDTLVEIEGSEWIAELMEAASDRLKRRGETISLRHFMIYLDSAGCFEFAAEAWEEIPETPNPV